MGSAFGDMLDLWMWPVHAAKAAGEAAETMLAAQRVVAARMPTIAAAAANPWTADHAELGRMVTEKTSAFGHSGRVASAAMGDVGKAARANMAAAARLARGELLWPVDWMRLAADNLAAGAAWATLPGDALAPVRRRVAANDRRLARRG